MHAYLPYLLKDIAAAHRPEEPEEISFTQSFEEGIEEIEKWLEGEEQTHTFGCYCGLEAENFPPTDQFTEEEIEMVNKAYKTMMCTWNLDTDFPETLPASIVYSMLVSILNEKTAIPHNGFITFDYCTGFAPDCIFKEYCFCL